LCHAVKNADESDIRLLKKNIVEAKNKIKKNVIAFADNVEFHILLARCSKNPVFVVVVQAIMAIGANYIIKANYTLEECKKTVEEHEVILNAIIGKETEKATRLFEDHIHRIGHWE
jgi:DNA-binding FadR family transcriptional regulator